MEPYRYAALESTDSIRLLLLEPASSKDDDLVGTLVQQTLTTFGNDINTHYAALSYVWGSSSRTKSIKLLVENAEHRLEMTNNLYMALAELREKHRRIWIWADAICIDQNNVAERGHQVKLMGDIYRNAGCTVIWLGSLTVDIRDIFEAAAPKEAARLKQAIEFLCSHEWFSRGWVFQELVLSFNPRVQCGQHRVGWKALRSIIQQFQWSQGLVSRFHDMDKARNDHTSRAFCQLVVSRKSARVSDPRDFFFSLMGITSDAEAVQTRLPVDYSLDVRDVFTRAAKYMIETVGLDAVFQHVVNSDTDDCDFSSFVPTWGIAKELPKMAAQKEQIPAGPLWGQRNVARDSLVMTIRSFQPKPKGILELGEILPRYTEFTEALRESLDRLSNGSQPDVDSPLQGLWGYWAGLIEHFGSTHRMQQETRFWAAFCSTILGCKLRWPKHDFLPRCTNNNQLTPQNHALELENEPLSFHSIKRMIKLIIRRLTFNEDEDDTVPQCRLARCGAQAVIVPADTMYGDMVVNLTSESLWPSRQSDRNTWFVVRTAGHELCKEERDQFVNLKGYQKANGHKSYLPSDDLFVKVRGIAKVVEHPMLETEEIEQSRKSYHMVLV